MSFRGGSIILIITGGKLVARLRRHYHQHYEGEKDTLIYSSGSPLSVRAECLVQSDTALRGCLRFCTARLMCGNNPSGAGGIFPFAKQCHLSYCVLSPHNPRRLAGWA